MKLTSEEFVNIFHTLPGDTIREKRKNLFLVLNDNADSKFDISNLKTSTLWEENLKFEVLKFYKNNSQMLELLQEENPAVIEKILKLDWFIKGTFGYIDGKRLVQEIFPNLSYNTKLKLLNQLGLILEDSHKCDEYFIAVKETYGTYLAAKLLPGCNQTLILKTLEDARIELTSAQLLVMIRKNSSITEKIFEKLYNYNHNVELGNKYSFIFKYLLQNDLPTFIRLNEKYPSGFKLGKRASRTFITGNRDTCLNHSKKLHKLLSEVVIAKSLNGKFPKFFSNIFPKSLQSLIDNFEYLSKMLKTIKDEDKFSLMLNTFESHYGGDLLQHHQFVTAEVFQWMSVDHRIRFFETHSKPKEISEESWISFMTTDKSLRLIKDKILLTSNLKARERLVVALVKTCRVNKDEDALENVCEYMVQKHRNDQFIIRRTFLETVSNCYDLKKLHLRHWKHLNELIKPMSDSNECTWLCAMYIQDYIYICFKNDLPATEYLKLWLRQSYSPYSIFNDNPKYLKRCLAAFPELIPLCFSEDLKLQYSSYLFKISKWNKSHPQEKISIFNYKEILDIVLQTIVEPGWSYEAQEVAMHCIISDFQKASEMNILDMLFNKCRELCTRVNISWLLEHHFLDILPFINSIMKYTVKGNFAYYKVREAFMLVLNCEVKEAVSALCKDAINDPDDLYKKSYMSILSAVLTSKDFLLYVDKHCPKSDSGNYTISKFQQHLPYCLQNITPPHLTLPIILKYCQGDCMKYTQNVLYRTCNNVAEKRLGAFINELSTRPVSVRKHSTILGLKLLKKEDINMMLHHLMTNENNLIIRKTLLKSLFNLFLRNPDDFLWQLVTECVEAIPPDDTEAFCKLANSKRVPKVFFVRYILFAWKTLEKLAYDDKLEEGKSKILEAIAPDKIALLPNEFCVELIQNNLFQKSHPKLQNELNAFTSKYLIYSEYNCMDQIFVVIKRFSGVSPKMVYDFVQTFCLYFIKHKCNNIGVLTSFNTLWNLTLKPFEALENYLHIQFTVIFIECRKEKSVEEIGRRLAQLCNLLFDLGSLDISIFKEVLCSFKDSFLDEIGGNVDEDNLLLISSIIKNGNSDACLSLALALMPLDSNVSSKINLQYDTILEGASSNLHPLVQIQLHCYFINKLL